jgi:hypothetical protein
MEQITVDQSIATLLAVKLGVQIGVLHLLHVTPVQNMQSNKESTCKIHIPIIEDQHEVG